MNIVTVASCCYIVYCGVCVVGGWFKQPHLVRLIRLGLGEADIHYIYCGSRPPRSMRGEIKTHYHGPFAAFTLRSIEGAPETQPARPAISRIGKTCALNSAAANQRPVFRT